MSSDFYSLLKRYLGRRVTLTLHGQMGLCGRLANVSFDGIRVTEARFFHEMDAGNPLSPYATGEESPGPGSETLVHLNQVLAITCLEEDLPPEAEGQDGAVAEEAPHLLVPSIELRLGLDLAELLNTTAEANLRHRLTELRNQVSQDLGVPIAPIAVSTHPRLPAQGFTVLLRGVAVARGHLEPQQLVALETPRVKTRVAGKWISENPFPHPAAWIAPGLRDAAEQCGYQILSPSTVLIARLHEILRQRAADLLGRQQLEELLDQARSTMPAVVDELVPEILRPRQLQRIFQALLREGVPLVHLETILESLAEATYETTDPDRLVDFVRMGLASVLTQRYADAQGRLAAIAMEAPLEVQLLRQVSSTPQGPRLELSTEQGRELLARIASQLDELQQIGRVPLMITPQPLRSAVSHWLRESFPQAVVLCREEIAPATPVEIVGVVANSPAEPGSPPRPRNAPASARAD